MGQSAGVDVKHVTDGGRELRAFLTRKGISVPKFCELHGLDRIQVQRALNGERWKRITVDFAHSIEIATAGEVPMTAWRSVTADDSGVLPASTDTDESG